MDHLIVVLAAWNKKLEFLIELRNAVSEKFPNQRFEPLDTRIDYWDRRANLPKARWVTALLDKKKS